MRKEDLLQVANRALSAGIPLEEFVWKNRAQLPCIYYHAGKRLVPHPTASHRSTFPGGFWTWVLCNERYSAGTSIYQIEVQG